MCLWHPTATLITLHLLKARLKLLKKTEQAGGTVFRETVYRRPLAVTVRYGTQLFLCGTVRYGRKNDLWSSGTVRYAFLPVPSVSVRHHISRTEIQTISWTSEISTRSRHHAQSERNSFPRSVFASLLFSKERTKGFIPCVNSLSVSVDR